MKKTVKWISIIILCFGIVFIGAGFLPQVRPENAESIYIEMPDSTELCARLRLPEEAINGEKVPVVIEMTRYGTEYKIKSPIRNLVNILRVSPNNNMLQDEFVDKGYASLFIDMRGTGASGGSRETEWSETEINDIYHIINWAVSQPWSNGRVGTYGFSYSGNMAEWSAAINHPALKVVSPNYSDFDPVRQLVYPGGVLHEEGLKHWNDFNYLLDKDPSKIKEYPIIGHIPVDEDKSGKQLREYIKSRENGSIYDQLVSIDSLDYVYVNDRDGTDVALYSQINNIEQGMTPYIIFDGWMDAQTVNGTLERFNTLDNSQIIYIGPWNHTGEFFYDPLLEEAADEEYPDEVPSIMAGPEGCPNNHLFPLMVEYFDRFLKEEYAEEDKIIHYYTLGSGKWKVTDSWPIQDFETKDFYLTDKGELADSVDKPTVMTYEVDYTFNTGEHNRWYGNFSGGQYDYSAFEEEAKKLISFTTKPLEISKTITGNPVVHLELKTNQNAGAVYVYLQDVSPSGKVTYLGEGILNLVHRKVSEDVPYMPLTSNHSLLTKDKMPAVPDEWMTLEVPINAISAEIKEGHQIRISIGGHDASGFQELVEDHESPTINQILLGTGSYVSLPYEN